MNAKQPAYVRVTRGEPQVRRWKEQRWILDNVIQANGPDWDQPRTKYLQFPCGMEASADFEAIRGRVKKYEDLSPAFAATARRREAKAKAAEEQGSPVTARDSYFMAAVHWGAAQWPFHDNVDENNNPHTNNEYRRYQTWYQGATHSRLRVQWTQDDYADIRSSDDEDTVYDQSTRAGRHVETGQSWIGW